MDVQVLTTSRAREAGALLAERHRDHAPLGAAHVLTSDTSAVDMATAALDAGVGYAAMQGSALTGFLIAPIPSMPG